jgi:hypothetical protein
MRCIPLIGLYNTPYYDVESVDGVFSFQFLGFSRYFGASLLAAILGLNALDFEGA